jgi:hypothetical protein
MRKNIIEAVYERGQKWYDPPIWAANTPRPIAIAVQRIVGNPVSRQIEYVIGHEKRRRLNWRSPDWIRPEE